MDLQGEYWYFYNLPLYKKNKMVWPPGLRSKVNTLGAGPENHHWFCAIRLRVGRTPRPRVKEAVQVILDCLTGVLGIDRLDWTPQNRCNGSNLPCSHVASILYYKSQPPLEIYLGQGANDICNKESYISIHLQRLTFYSKQRQVACQKLSVSCIITFLKSNQNKKKRLFLKAMCQKTKQKTSMLQCHY